MCNILEFQSRNVACRSPLLFADTGKMLGNVEVGASSSMSGREPQQAWLYGDSCWKASSTDDDQFYMVSLIQTLYFCTIRL